jgi:hypothetical protein
MGKKIIKIMISVLVVCTLLMGCTNYKYGPLSGDYSSSAAVESNGGFVSQKGDYTYFINGIDYNYSDNTFPNPVKASLMRVKTADIYSDTAEYQIVVPRLMVTGAFVQGFYISGDYVYYATPTSAKNKAGTVEYSYLDLTRTKLDGTDTLKLPYFRLETNTTDFRFMEFNNTVYIVYVLDNDIYSYNTSTKTETVLVDDAAAVILSSNLGENTLYYTKDVKDVGTENIASYNEVYSINGDGSDNKLIISGLGKDRDKNPTTTIDINNKMITLIKASDGYLYYTAKENNNLDSEYGYALKLSNLTADSNAENDDDEIQNFFKAVKINNLDYVKATTVFIEDNEMLYVDSTYGIIRYTYSYNVDTDECTSTELQIVKQPSTPELLYTKGVYLYYKEAGTNGSKLFRIQFDGFEENYYKNYSSLVVFYEKQQIGEIDYSKSWYNPEIIGDTLFFPNAANLSYNYVFVYDLTKWNIEDNEEYKAHFLGIRSDADQESYETAYEAAYDAALKALEALDGKSDDASYKTALSALNKLSEGFTQAKYKAAFDALYNLKTESNKTLFETALAALKSL